MALTTGERAVMQTRAAVCHGIGEAWKVQEIEIDPPGPTEVRVRMSFAGLCHSDEHVREGDIGAAEEDLAELGVTSLFPIVGGHEGAGIVQEVGSRVTTVAPGDRVAISF